MPDIEPTAAIAAKAANARAILRPPQAAAYTGLAVSTLAKRRLRGERPTFVKLSKRAVGYHVDELDAWLAESRRASTSANFAGHLTDSKSNRPSAGERGPIVSTCVPCCL